VPVRVNLKGKNGEFESIVTLSFTDGQVAELVLKGEYYPNMPTSIEVGRVQRGARCGTYYWATSDAGNESVVVDTGDSPVLEGRITKTQNAGVLVSFTTRPDAPSGDFASVARVTGGAHDTPLQVQVSGRVAADVEADSEVVSFGYAEQNASDTKLFATTQFYSPYKVRFSFDPAASSLPQGFAIDSVTEGENGRTKISVRVEGHKLALGLYSEKARFAFSVGDSTVTIPITLYGYVLERPATADAEG
jgi:hypothetical protein